jgi:hypothetical protein
MEVPASGVVEIVSYSYFQGYFIFETVAKLHSDCTCGSDSHVNLLQPTTLHIDSVVILMGPPIRRPAAGQAEGISCEPCT